MAVAEPNFKRNNAVGITKERTSQIKKHQPEVTIETLTKTHLEILNDLVSVYGIA